MLKNEHGWYLQNHELYPLLKERVLGWTEHVSRLPVTGFMPIEVNGVTFKCEAQSPGTKKTWRGTNAHRAKHRLFYLCKECAEWIPFGRAGQHRKGQKHKNNAVIW